MLINNFEYIKVLENIKKEIVTAQYKASVHVNVEMLLLYHDIGRIINSHKAWGNKFIENLVVKTAKSQLFC